MHSLIRGLFNRCVSSRTQALAASPRGCAMPEALESRRLLSTVYVSSGGDVDAAIRKAGDGGTVILRDGTYRGGIQVEQDDVTIKAQNEGKAVIKGKSGQQLLTARGGDDVTVKGIVFRGGGINSDDNTKAAVKTASGWTVEDCVIEDTAGVGLAMFGRNVTVKNVISQDNGMAGIGGSPRGDSKLLDSISRRNNQKGTTANGGGGKFTRVDGLLVDGYKSYDNKGPGLWFDYININVTVQNSEVYNNGNSYKNGRLHAGGAGIFFEISGVQVKKVGDKSVSKEGDIVIRNNEVRDNAQEGIQIWGTQNVEIFDNEVKDNDDAQIMLRGGRSNPFQSRDILVEDNDLSGKNKIKADRDVDYDARNN